MHGDHLLPLLLLLLLLLHRDAQRLRHMLPPLILQSLLPLPLQPLQPLLLLLVPLPPLLLPAVAQMPVLCTGGCAAGPTGTRLVTQLILALPSPRQ